MLAGQAIFADDTPVKMLAPGTGKTATARLWAYGRDERPWGSDVPPASWYQFSPDRKGQHPKNHLAKYQGWMHAPSRDIAPQCPAGQWTALPGSKTSGKAAAVVYTPIETAKLNGIDPQAWLADTLARIPDYKINRVDDLLPRKTAS